MMQKTMNTMIRKEIFGGIIRMAALVIIMSMLAGACSKNDGPEDNGDNTEQPSKPGEGDNQGDNGSGDGSGGGPGQGGEEEGGTGESGGSGGSGSEGGSGGSGSEGGSGDNGEGGGNGSGEGNEGEGGGNEGGQPTDPDKPQVAATNWMTLLDDNTKVALLTIPGTHDAATSTCSAMGKCQTLTIPQQLECGVRAFDLRPTMDNNTTLGNIYHTILDTGVSMADAMTYFDNFLKAHPGEGIIVLMRYESERQIFGSISEDYYKSAMKNFLWDNKIYQSRMAAFNKSMTMKDLRGRILIISRNDLSPVSTFETAYTQWSHSNSVGEALYIYGTGGLGRIYVQDMYSTAQNGNSSEADFLAKKKELVCKLLDITVPFREGDQNNWVINYCSGYAGSALASDSYAKNAASTNPAALEHIRANTGKGFTGIVMMDYAGTDTYEVGGSSFNVSGKSLTEALILNNC